MPDANDQPDRAAPVEKVPERAGFRLAAFAAVLVIVLFAAYGVGRLNNGAATGQTGSTAPAAATGPAAATDDGHGHSASGQAGVPPHDETGRVTGGSTVGDDVGGLTVTNQGLTLVPEKTTFAAGRAGTFVFTVTGSGGVPITTYQVVHDKPLHLIVVRRDLTGFQHLHPSMASDGTWRTPLTLAEPGSYRAIADFTASIGGRQVATTLGVDLAVPGHYRPIPLPAPSRQAVTDTFTVTYQGQPRTGSTQPLVMTVTKGRPVQPEPYLGAFGHLVVFREGDIAYVHVHPEAELADGKIKFWLAAPGAGRYRMFLDFQVGGTVHTAAWTAVVE
ncbi:MAG TPA: hypothetical protein VFH03_01245 [Actinoplanes sp.]|nr:hypothetical protein [Actinoplanes sp.]